MDPPLPPALCRAARGLLGLSQSAFARRAGVSRSTVADFEREARRPLRRNLEAMRRTFEELGILFLDGEGVRFADRREGGRS